MVKILTILINPLQAHAEELKGRITLKIARCGLHMWRSSPPTERSGVLFARYAVEATGGRGGNNVDVNVAASRFDEANRYAHEPRLVFRSERVFPHEPIPIDVVGAGETCMTVALKGFSDTDAPSCPSRDLVRVFRFDAELRAARAIRGEGGKATDAGSPSRRAGVTGVLHA